MSISANYPTIRPSLLLDFANSEILDPRITFSRPTTATYYDNHTSVLAEQNLIIGSSTLNTALYGIGASNPVSGATDPAGGATAFTVTAASGNTSHEVIYGSGLSILAATNYVFSCYLQAGTNNFVSVGGYVDAGNYVVATYNLTSGSVAFSQQSAVGTYSIIGTPTIVQVGSTNWYRCSITFSTTSATSVFHVTAQLNNTVAPTYTYYGAQVWTALGTETILIYGAQLEQRSSVTAYNATTTTAITNYIPVLQTAASNQARFDHDPVTRTSLGFLIEQQSTNLILQSQSYNTSWTLTNATLTSGANIAPDGTQTAFNLVDSTATGLQAISQTVTKAASAIAYTDAQYFKANTRTYSWMQLSDGAGNGAIVYFNLSTGAISTAVAGVGTAFTALSATINPVGNGWYRCTLSATSNTATSIVKQFGSSTNGTSNSFTGNGYSGIYIWGSQLEALAFSTSYIPTVASQVTRSADIANMTGNNFSSWFNIAQGTYYVEFNVLQNTQSIPILANSNGNPILYQQGPNFGFYDGTNQGGGYVGAISLNTFYKGAISMTPSTNTLSLSGTSGSAFITNGKFLSQPNLQIGYGYNSPQSFVGHFKKIAYYPLALPAANLQALTGS